MMKFFQDKNPPRVWDKVKNKVTVVFQNGAFETDDPVQIDLLVGNGYRYDGELPEAKPVKVSRKEDTVVSKPKRVVRKKK